MPPPHTQPRPDPLRSLLLMLAAAAAGMAALLAFFPAAGHDQLWFLLMARRWLGGAQLYGPEAFDSNAPAVVWLSAIPVALGHVLHLPATTLAKALVTALATGCAALAATVLPRAWRPLRHYEPAALLFAAIVLVGVVPARDLGQRDQLVSFLLLPYVLLAALDPLRARLLPQRLAAAALAAAAVSLKPHYALVPLAVEAALLLAPAALTSAAASHPHDGPFIAQLPRDAKETATPPSRFRRLLRPEPVVLLALGALYLLAIRRFAPLYFTSALPLTRAVYAGIGHLTLPQLLWEAVELCVLAVLSLAFPAHRSPAVRLLQIAGLAAFAAFLVQGTGWYYQQLPAITLFGAALTLQMLDRLPGRALRLPRWALPTAAGLCVLALALTTHFTGYPFTPDRAFAIDSPDPALFRTLPPGTPVALLTTSVDEAMMPIERFHLTWAQRTNNLWTLPELLRAERPEGQPARHLPPPAQLAALDASQHRWMVEDLTRWQPQLVLIERCQDPAVRCQVLEDRHDDLLAWFARDPAFAALWRDHYHFSGTDARFDIYTRRP